MADDFEKIRRNVSKMIEQSAPDADIIEYLSTERLSPDEFRSVATGKMKLGDVRMTQKSMGEIARAQSVDQTIPDPGIHRGTIIPRSRMLASGEDYWDPDAGFIGMFKRAAKTVGDVASGELDPNSEEGARRQAEFAMTFTPMGIAPRAAQATVPGTLKSLSLGLPKVPTAQELKSAGSAGFDAARSLGVDYDPDAVLSMLDDLTRTLADDGVNDITAPKTSAILSSAKVAPDADGGDILQTLDNLISLRKSLQKAAGSGDATERGAASRAIDAVDEFVAQADPKGVVAGPASAAGSILDDARGNYAAGMRSSTVDKAITKAERNAAKSNSGQNLDNALRSRIESILEKDARGFSKDEKQLLVDIVMGKHGANLARRIGNLLGGGGGLGASVAGTIGGALGLGIGGAPGMAIGGIALPALGAGAKQLGAAITRAGAKNVDEITRMRSPLFEAASKSPPVNQSLRPDVRLLLEKLFLPPAAETFGNWVPQE